MDLEVDPGHPSFRTALATGLSALLLLVAITLVLFVLPYLLVSAA